MSQLPKDIFSAAFEAPRSDQPVYPFVIDNQSEIVGTTDLHNVDIANRRAELGIVIFNTAGSLVAGRALCSLLRFAFADLGLNRVGVRILQSNQNCLRQALGMGFQLEGIERQACFTGEGYEDIVILSLLRAEFERKWS